MAGHSQGWPALGARTAPVPWCPLDHQLQKAKLSSFLTQLRLASPPSRCGQGLPMPQTAPHASALGLSRKGTGHVRSEHRTSRKDGSRLALGWLPTLTPHRQARETKGGLMRTFSWRLCPLSESLFRDWQKARVKGNQPDAHAQRPPSSRPAPPSHPAPHGGPACRGTYPAAPHIVGVGGRLLPVQLVHLLQLP